MKKPKMHRVPDGTVDFLKAALGHTEAARFALDEDLTAAERCAVVAELALAAEALHLALEEQSGRGKR